MQLVYGVGINDADYTVRHCSFYQRWVMILRRCYNTQENRPTYKDCKVCEEWLTFSNFRAWMETQDWEGKQLDKDIITPGNKIYSPEQCMFVTQAINSLLTVSKSSKGLYPVGVSFKKRYKLPFVATISYNGTLEIIGRFADPLTAHFAWNRRKREIITEVIDNETDSRIAAGLRLRVEMLDRAYENKSEIFCL